jgi:Mn-dependent DtxR family transcriptional regulator
MIGVDEITANIYAEGIEHHIRPETLKARKICEDCKKQHGI